MKIYTLSQITGAEHFSQSLAAPENPGGEGRPSAREGNGREPRVLVTCTSWY